MINWIDQIDKTIFLFLNSKHSESSDAIWMFITNIPTWIPLYILILVLIIKVFKKDSPYFILGLL